MYLEAVGLGHYRLINDNYQIPYYCEHCRNRNKSEQTRPLSSPARLERAAMDVYDHDQTDESVT